MGLVWLAVWAGVGMVIEWIHDWWPNPLGRMVDIWPAVLGLPAFFGGVTFSVFLGIVARGRKFSELSVPGFAALGALGGALVSQVPTFMVLLGLADLHGPATLWQITLPLMVPVAIMGGTSAAATLMLARRSERLEPLSAGERRPELGEAE
jgi:hypothetical protein